MRILLISTQGFPINAKTKYAGIERLVRDFSQELTRQGHEVSVIGPAGSEYPEGVSFLPAPLGMGANEEMKGYQLYQGLFPTFDAIHDFSHHHLASRFSSRRWPIVSAFWHAPALAKYPKAPYNIMAPSKWAAVEFERVYGQKARVQDIIIVDPTVYRRPERERGYRFMCLGRMGPEKGNLNAVNMCSKLGLPLDVCGSRGAGREYDPLDAYELEIIKGCDGNKIVFRGEVDDARKLALMQSCRALLYITDHPEVTNHKVQEAMLCGAAVVAPRHGAQPEIVTQGVNGFLCLTPQEYEHAIQHVDDLPVTPAYEAVVARWRPEMVVSGYVKVYEAAARGERW